MRSWEIKLSKGLSDLLNLSGEKRSPKVNPANSSAQKRELVELAIESISPNEYQPRTEFDPEELEGLAASIAEVGVLQPILVRPNDDGETYELIAGERRWRAAQIANLATIPAVVGSYSDRDSLEQAIVENLHRQDLNPIEEALAYERLAVDFGLGNSEIAERVGKSRPAIVNSRRLLNLPRSVIEQVKEERLSAGHARTLLALDDSELVEDLASRVETQGLSVRAVEDIVRKANSPTDRSSARTSSGNFAHLEVASLLEDYLSTRCTVSGKSSTGKISIEFADLDDLGRILDLIVPNQPPKAP